MCYYWSKKNNLQLTPLHIAYEFGHLSVVDYLTEKGADIEAKDWNGKTHLYLASENGKTKVAKFVLSTEGDKHVSQNDDKMRKLLNEEKGSEKNLTLLQ